MSRQLKSTTSHTGTARLRSAEEWLPLVYDELRKLAAARLAREPPGETIQPTALVHEAYLRLVHNARRAGWKSRGHFFGAAAKAMRRIVVENARRRRAQKRGGRWQRQHAELDTIQVGDDRYLVLVVDEALDRLAQQYPLVAKLVEMKFFAGMTLDDIAASLGFSSRTAYRYWAYARAWLREEMSDDGLAS